MQGNMGLMVSVEALRDRMWVWVLKRFFWLPSRELLQVEAGSLEDREEVVVPQVTEDEGRGGGQPSPRPFPPTPAPLQSENYVFFL